MRLGKEQAVGYVEDTGYVEDAGADSLPAQELTIGRPDGLPLTSATAPAVPAS